MNYKIICTRLITTYNSNKDCPILIAEIIFYSFSTHLISEYDHSSRPVWHGRFQANWFYTSWFDAGTFRRYNYYNYICMDTQKYIILILILPNEPITYLRYSVLRLRSKFNSRIFIYECVLFTARLPDAVS